MLSVSATHCFETKEMSKTEGLDSLSTTTQCTDKVIAWKGKLADLSQGRILFNTSNNESEQYMTTHTVEYCNF